MQLEYSCSAKSQHGFKSMLAFSASHEACRRMAVFLIQLTGKLHQTGEPWHLSCHGGKTSTNPHVPLHPCAPVARSPKGAQPPSHEACRRMAVFLIQLTGKLHQTGEPWHLSCHGGKTPANLHIPLRPCALKARSPKKGAQPLKSSASWTGGSKSSAMPV